MPRAVTMVCRLCDTDRPLIKAHVVPEGFFRVFRDMQVFSNKRGAHPRRSPTGVYDKSILCQNCDNGFSPWDKHAQEVLLHDFSDETAIYYGARKIGWKITRFDYRSLKLFFLSLLWRASVSTHEFYRRISIGPLEAELRAMIVNADPGVAETFAVTLSRFDHPALRGMLDPHRERYDGVNYCRFYLAGFVAHIKVDRRPPPEFLSDLIIRDGMPIIVLLRNTLVSKDIAVMRDIARRSLKRGG